MKKIILILTIVMFACFAYSQTYHKLIRTNTYWDNFRYSDVPIFNSCYAYAARIYFTGSDTIINGLSYNKSNGYNFTGEIPMQGVICPPLAIENTSLSTNIFVREDTVAKRVYIYDENYTPHEQLLYDFSLQIGDTLHSNYNGNNSLVVTNIDSVTLTNGEIRKRISFQGLPTLSNYIEGIGGSQGLFYPFEWPAMSVAYGGYFCISEDGISIWGSDCTNYFVGISENHHDVLGTFSPNPANTNLMVRLNKAKHVVIFQLVNIEGQLITSRTLTEVETGINLSNVAQGLYIARLISDEGTVNSRIIITHEK
jgi:hypothetical protein